jgi:hypothetical protein
MVEMSKINDVIHINVFEIVRIFLPKRREIYQPFSRSQKATFKRRSCEVLMHARYQTK